MELVNLLLRSFFLAILLSNVTAHLSRQRREITHSEDCPTPMTKGTTPNLEHIFVGRCLEFQQIHSSRYNCPGARVNCSDAWLKFKEAVVGQDPCNINDNAYDELLDLIPIEFADDMTLFWSGTNKLAHGYAAASPTTSTLEDSMLGYMVNGLNWCSSEGSDEYSSDPCPDQEPDSCTHTSTGVFWASVSTMLAKQASGIAIVMVNGSSPWPAFYNGSFFAKYELPNLDPDKVTNVRIIVAHNIGGPINEQCGRGSVKTMQELTAARGLAYTCEGTPRDVQSFQCVENAGHAECQPRTDATGGIVREGKMRKRIRTQTEPASSIS
ncbi:ADP-ribosyl cyclase/cyclic ADP-ribose hydrolase-like [Amphiura filiformis]|uniref:ADP-ribosyl cyclase/cyclic ADP-ribose hydrolase-like n=1 Tax=Amphiura filiformis TaxID=82378 RepID=UPI003B225CCC